MKLLTNGLKWFTAVAVAVAGIGLGGGSLVAPDPAFAKFDVDKLTIGGDIRVRPEYRRGLTWGGAATVTASNNNQAFVQQRTRLRINYDVSADVNYFVEFQDSRNWGTTTGTDNPITTGGGAGGGNLGANQNSVNGDALGVREAWIGIKNAGLQNLSLKIGRQKVIFGDHRLLGHFDWNNVGFSLDGLRADYASPMGTHTLGWFRIDEENCDRIDTGNCIGGTLNSTIASNDSDLLVWYNTFKNILPGGTIEPYWFFLMDGRTAGTARSAGIGTPLGQATTLGGRVANDQKRHFFGTRINGKAMNKMVDYTGEFVWQTGQQKNAASIKQTINAWAMAVKAGVTFKDVMWKPRIGFEIDYASGSDKNDGSGGRHTFEGLFPTNHLHYGYMDRAAWKNIVDYSPQLLVRPDKASNLKINLHILRLANSKDNWYTAGQGTAGGGVTDLTNQAASLGQELDIVYTRKFKEGKVGFQIGYGHFFSGEYNEASKAGTGGNSTAASPNGDTDQDWGYFQVTTKF